VDVTSLHPASRLLAVLDTAGPFDFAALTSDVLALLSDPSS
jgi:hypothetical protein